MVKKTYQELKIELDEIMTRLQAGELGVDESTKLYELGMKIVSELEARLKSAENTVKKIKKTYEKA